jgi:hypothetical protein
MGHCARGMKGLHGRDYDFEIVGDIYMYIPTSPYKTHPFLLILIVCVYGIFLKRK